MTKEEALKMSLEALEVANSCIDGYYIPKGKTHLPEIEKATIAIKEALANSEKKLAGEGILIGWDTKTDTPIFANPPQRKWVGLTDEEIWELMCRNVLETDLCRAVEAKLKEKNT
jgi:hypothetical protein